MNRGELSEYFDAAKEAAIEAGKLLADGLNSNNRVSFKGEVDLVTEMDLRSETLIRELLANRFENIYMLAEEGGETGNATGLKWLVDPLDGTTSYAHRLPHFCVSIALEAEGEVVLGVVYNPCLDELFCAAKGEGATMNGRAIKVSGTKELKRSLLATGFPYDRATSSQNNLDHFNNFMSKIQGIRRMGSAALDLCYTAAGRFDGFWEMKLSPWDTAAASVILKEAGGMVTSFSGDHYSIYDREILGSNGIIHDDMVDILTGGG